MAAARPLTWLARIAALALAGAILPGCADEPALAEDGVRREKVTIAGETFRLELAVDDETRTRGLGGREEIAPDGGMLFVFDRAARRSFIMRDCLVPIDIIYLDRAGRVLTMHHMPVEPPRGPDEGVVGDWDPRRAENRRYEQRLKKYSSRFPTQFVIEVKGGTLERLELEEGDRIDLDIEKLKELVR